MAGPVLCDPEELRKALGKGAVVVDVRGGEERLPDICVAGAIHCPWDMSTSTMTTEGLPANKDALIIVHCAKGGRAAKAIEFLKTKGYTNLLNGGGQTTKDQWDVLMTCPSCGPSVISKALGACSPTQLAIVGVGVVAVAILLAARRK
mmetsp:Transcript_73825/g.175745  ORF Transcript_73825/g.175745 Transcript_73825/m.175745 type:complete len:148 (-) Transcript_73825:211-654(-)